MALPSLVVLEIHKEIRKYLQHQWGCNPHPPEADLANTHSPPPIKKLFFKEKWLGGATNHILITSKKEIRKYLQHQWGCNPHPPEADLANTHSPPPIKKLFFKEKWLGGA
ncbi:MAG: hypothetical protein SNG45_08930, partial [Rikenellaceae bacterium]